MARGCEGGGEIVFRPKPFRPCPEAAFLKVLRLCDRHAEVEKPHDAPRLAKLGAGPRPGLEAAELSGAQWLVVLARLMFRIPSALKVGLSALSKSQCWVFTDRGRRCVRVPSDVAQCKRFQTPQCAGMFSCVRWTVRNQVQKPYRIGSRLSNDKRGGIVQAGTTCSRQQCSRQRVVPARAARGPITQCAACNMSSVGRVLMQSTAFGLVAVAEATSRTASWSPPGGSGNLANSWSWTWRSPTQGRTLCQSTRRRAT